MLLQCSLTQQVKYQEGGGLPLFLEAESIAIVLRMLK